MNYTNKSKTFGVSLALTGASIFMAPHLPLRGFALAVGLTRYHYDNAGSASRIVWTPCITVQVYDLLPRGFLWMRSYSLRRYPNGTHSVKVGSSI